MPPLFRTFGRLGNKRNSQGPWRNLMVLWTLFLCHLVLTLAYRASLIVMGDLYSGAVKDMGAFNPVVHYMPLRSFAVFPIQSLSLWTSSGEGRGLLVSGVLRPPSG
jgi:hypothetical protein